MRRSYAGGATKGTPTSPVTTLAPSMAITPVTGWPDGSAGPFAIKVGRGTANEEKMLVSAFNGSTVTFLQRGYDGTTPQNHATSEVVELVTTGIDADEANAHVNTVGGVHGLNTNDPVVGRATPANLTGKTMSGLLNAFSAIPRLASPELMSDISALTASITTLTAGVAAAATTAALNAAITAEQTARSTADSAEATARAAADALLLSIASAAATYLPLAGGSVSGHITDSAGDPSAAGHLARKAYVDAGDAATVAGIYATGKVRFSSQVLTTSASGNVDFDYSTLGFTTILGLVVMNGDGASGGVSDAILSQISGAGANHQRIACRTNGGASIGSGVNIRINGLVLGTV